MGGVLAAGLTVVLVVGLSGCTAGEEQPAEARQAAQQTGQQTGQQSGQQSGAQTGHQARRATRDRRVLAISVDGLNPDAIRRLGTDRAPSLHRMLREGAGTLNARNALERTVTLPNHTGMLTGRRVLSSRGHHVTMNEDPGGTIADLAGRYVPSLFDTVHDRGGSTALLTQKEKFALFNRSWGPTTGAKDTTGADNGRDKIDRYVMDDDARVLVDKAVKGLRGDNPTRATFLHLALPDQAGHQYGYMSPRYLDAVARTDRLLGRILDAVTSEPRLARTVDVVLTADHGGRGLSHSVVTKPANYTIPFLAWGVDVAKGRGLYRLNPTRTDPGTGRPGYDDPPPIRNTDLASLVTRLLGEPAVSGSLPRTKPLDVS